MFQGVKVFGLPPVLWLPLPAVAPPTLVPKRRSEVRGAQGRGCSPQPPSAVKTRRMGCRAR